MRRSQPHETQFGSDSFLDVVCNIVGILIILIVVAGVRVSRAPVRTDKHSPQTVLAHLPLGETLHQPIPEAEVPSPFLPLMVEEQEAPPPDSDDSQAILTQLADIQEQQTHLSRELREAQETIARLHEQQSAWTERVQSLRRAVLEAEARLSQAQQTAASTTAEISSLKQQAMQLAAQVREAELTPTQAKRWEHRLTPVGKTVTGRELHFRVERQQVSVIPLERLLLRLREQIERRKDWLVKGRQSEGEVGPIEGYTLHYVVQRDQLSAVEELRYGTGMYRISVAQWELQVGEDSVSEPVDKALLPGSRFYQALLQAENDDTLTFWVYPDSFEAFRRLKAYCHEQNFLVAGRPMPAGLPIAGSPHGTRSSGQ